MSSKGDRFKVKQVDLNLTPIMGLMVLLIPMILYLYNFFEVKVQAVAAPRLGSGAAKPPDGDEKKPLNLTIHIGKSGFGIKVQEELSANENVTPIPKRAYDGFEGEDYDYPALYARLYGFKDRYKDETTVNISADLDIPWQTVARTIDAARLKLVEPLFDDMKKFSEAKVLEVDVPDKNGDGKPEKETVEMFSRVVFVVAETVN